MVTYSVTIWLLNVKALVRVGFAAARIRRVRRAIAQAELEVHQDLRLSQAAPDRATVPARAVQLQNLPDGSVLLQDICTKDGAMPPAGHRSALAAAANPEPLVDRSACGIVCGRGVCRGSARGARFRRLRFRQIARPLFAGEIGRQVAYPWLPVPDRSLHGKARRLWRSRALLRNDLARRDYQDRRRDCHLCGDGHWFRWHGYTPRIATLSRIPHESLSLTGNVWILQRLDFTVVPSVSETQDSGQYRQFDFA
jgi:hypothetical protein